MDVSAGYAIIEDVAAVARVSIIKVYSDGIVLESITSSSARTVDDISGRGHDFIDQRCRRCCKDLLFGFRTKWKELVCF